MRALAPKITSKYDKQPDTINFRPLLKKFNSRFLSQKKPYQSSGEIWRLLTQVSGVEFFEQGPKIYSFWLFGIVFERPLALLERMLWIQEERKSDQLMHEFRRPP
jgi:hypothetical protein